MQRGFLRAKSSRDTSGTAAAPSPHIVELRAKLEQAEGELRRRRQERLKVEAEIGKPVRRDGAWMTAPPEAFPPPVLDTAALEALASRPEEEPPAALHCLAAALVLLLEAPMLVGLGDHPLPGRPSWKNLRTLLSKAWSATDTSAGLVQALEQKPFGQRLKKHVCDMVGGDEPLTREHVTAADERCAPLFDFVEELLEYEVVPAAPASPAATAEAKEEPNLAREAAVAAVEEQEREVARLRKRLREAQRSEEAAQSFAADRAPQAGTGGARAAATPSGEKSPEPPSAAEQTAAPASKAAQPSEAPAAAAPAAASSSAQAAGADEPEAATHVVSRHRLQYRLNEVAVPPLQEAILQSLVSAALEPSARGQRALEVVGQCESREEPEIATQRAEAVRDWLLEQGVPAARLRMEARPGGDRSSRQTEVRLLDTQEVDEATRKRASDILARVLPEVSASSAAEREDAAIVDEPLARGDVPEESPQPVPAAATPPPAAPAASPARATPEKGAACEVSLGDPPKVSIEEVADTESPAGGGRSLRVVFTARALAASDTDLDVGEKAVRLASASGAWPAVEVPLPFAVEPPAPTAARFSRKAGTLTLLLRAAGAAAATS